LERRPTPVGGSILPTARAGKTREKDIKDWMSIKAATMPPKPFNPPRPSIATPAQKPKGRPKGSTNKSKDTASTGTSRAANGIKKAPKGGGGAASAGNSKAKEARLSAASIRSLLPSLSPDTSDAEIDSAPEEEAVEADSDDPFASQPRASASTSKPRRPSHSHRDPRGEDEDSAHAAGFDHRKEKIPEDLLSVILSRMFTQEGTRMSRDAVKAVSRYMNTFVREGVARGAWAGQERGNGGKRVLFICGLRTKVGNESEGNSEERGCKQK
jgi:CENP-S associating Centromere protein X